MNISPVSGSTANNYTPLGESNEIKLLQEQKSNLQEQMQKIREGKMDNQTKQERIKELQTQIEQIDMQIAEKRSEKLNAKQTQKSDQDTVNNHQNAGNSQNNTNLSGMSQLVQANSSFSQVQIINRTKKGFEGRSNILRMEIKLDSARQGGNTAPKIKELGEIQSKSAKLDKKISSELKKTHEQVDAASDKANEAKTEDDIQGIQDETDINNRRTTRHRRQVDIRI